MPWPDGTQKNDLHRHLGGSISPETIAKLLCSQGRHLSEDDVRERLVCTQPQHSFIEFLARFDILNAISWDEAAIAESIQQVVKDQAAEQIDYAEVSLSIDKYLDGPVRWTRPEVIKFISATVQDACARWHTKVRLILSLRMESERYKQSINAALVYRTDVLEHLGGIDLVGDERNFDAKFYAPIFRDWRAAGRLTLVHAGETCGASNVFDAITVLHVHRVRHGIAAAGDKEVLAAARDLDVCFDVSLHSNLLAGTIRNGAYHLPALLSAGCAVTLGTDDPVVFNCRLDDEYEMAKKLGLLGAGGYDQINNTQLLRMNSIKYAGYRLCGGSS